MFNTAQPHRFLLLIYNIISKAVQNACSNAGLSAPGTEKKTRQGHKQTTSVVSMATISVIRAIGERVCFDLPSA